MANQVITQSSSQAGGRWLTWKNIWRVDAVANLLFGDLLLFAPNDVIDFMGMEADTITIVRSIGVLFIIYGVWQLWASRTGSISKTSFLIADVDMTLAGIASIAAVVLGAQFNGTGEAVMIGFMGIGAFVAAMMWFVASRYAD